MTVSFRLGRYLIALMGQWSVPVVIGIAIGNGLSLWSLSEVGNLLEEALTRSIQTVADSCKAPPNSSPPASGTGPPVAGGGGETG